MTKQVKFKDQVDTTKKVKKVKKSGQKRPPKPKSILIQSGDKIKKKEKRNKIKNDVDNETVEEDSNIQEAPVGYQLTPNDIQELKKPENKKNVISKRQLKREKLEKTQKEQREKSTNELIEKAWEYLDTWKNNKTNWKFQKVRQVWLTDNLFDSDKIPDNLWDVVIEYFSGSQGKVRSTIIEQSTKVVQEMSDWTEQKEQAEKDGVEFNTPKPCKNKYKRARKMLQSLQE
ncbi:uncharacterized protein C7orf50 homolog [Ctenocephalides felis]|uniref:uncharacterized protein C7orf50 homolog n=1 Tax=Ctenocephalides felis TaxID=7515 RepID=UPI000E6E34B9|nr:uncharacterized protein C7orf50 homolog [Ctenocephalides felis]